MSRWWVVHNCDAYYCLFYPVILAKFYWQQAYHSYHSTVRQDFTPIFILYFYNYYVFIPWLLVLPRVFIGFLHFLNFYLLKMTGAIRVLPRFLCQYFTFQKVSLLILLVLPHSFIGFLHPNHSFLLLSPSQQVFLPQILPQNFMKMQLFLLYLCFTPIF